MLQFLCQWHIHSEELLLEWEWQANYWHGRFTDSETARPQKTSLANSEGVGEDKDPCAIFFPRTSYDIILHYGSLQPFVGFRQWLRLSHILRESISLPSCSDCRKCVSDISAQVFYGGSCCFVMLIGRNMAGVLYLAAYAGCYSCLCCPKSSSCLVYLGFNSVTLIGVWGYSVLAESSPQWTLLWDRMAI